MSATFDRHEENHRILREAEIAVEASDFARARALLFDLHTYAHDEPFVHSRVHALDYRMARAERDRRAMASEVLPIVFASTIARLERLGPSTETVVRVAAPREVVYRVLTDFSKYAEWNPWLSSAEGGANVGDTVRAHVKLGTKAVDVGHRVLVATPAERFAWCDTGWFTPAARGRRLRTLVTDGDGTLLHTRLSIVGPLAGLVWSIEGANMQSGLEAETRALAARAERLAA